MLAQSRVKIVGLLSKPDHGGKVNSYFAAGGMVSNFFSRRGVLGAPFSAVTDRRYNQTIPLPVRHLP
jgi:hypothetical protein